MFFGGYRFFGLEDVSPFLSVAVLLFKAFIGYWIIMWVKYTLLRIRIDHMLAFNWKFLTPLAFILLMVTAFMNALLADAPTWLYVSGLFLSNVLIAWGALEIARSHSRKEREKIEGPKIVAEAAHH
jgi:NADH-quinone oxidoreductase subunit H